MISSISSAIISGLAAMAMAASRSPSPRTYPRPPVVHQTASSAPLLTATALAAAATAAPHVKRSDPTRYPQAPGILYKSSLDNSATFRADPYYSNAANVAKVPIGLKSVFTNTGASPNAPDSVHIAVMEEGVSRTEVQKPIE